MGDIQIKDLEEITTAPSSAFIPIDDGEVTKKISVANFNLTGANSAYNSAQSANASKEDALSYKTASQEANSSAEAARVAAVAAQTAAETAQDYAESAQTVSQGYAAQALAAKEAAENYAGQMSDATTLASMAKRNAEDAAGLAQSYAENCAEMAEDIASRINTAEGYASTATSKGRDAEAWADGQRDGVNVASTDPAYQNNAKYYAEQSATNASSASSSATAAESAKNTAEAKATLASNGATTANTRALDAEAWATGKRNNANVSNSDLAYNNNAKYYAQQASTNATNAAASQTAAENAKTAAINAKNSILASEANAAASASQAQTYAAQAEAATEKMPIVGNNGNWMVYDATEEQYIDSNKPSRGEVGATPVVTGSANVDSGVGTPSVTVVKTGTDAAPNFNFNFHNLKGAKGDPGNPGAAGKGIVSIAKTGTSGLTDTYTITYTDGTTSTFSVRNGADGSGGSGASYIAGNGINIADGAISVDTDSTPTANSSNPIASGWASNFASNVAATYATKDEVSEDYVSKNGLVNQQLNPLTTVVGVHAGNYSGYNVTTVDKANNVVGVTHKGAGYCGAYFEVPINPNIDNNINISISNVVTEVTPNVTLAMFIDINGTSTLLERFYISNGVDKTFSYVLTPTKIAELGLTNTIKFFLSTDKAISYDERVTNTYGSNTTIASIKSDVDDLKTGLKLVGKKAMFLGDSITALNNERSWVNKFCTLTGATKLVNVAVSGAWLMDKAGTVLDGNPVFNGADANVNNVLANQVQKIINNQYEAPDLIVIAIGTNGGIELDDTRLVNAFYKTVDGRRISTPLEELDRTHSEGAFRWCNETLHRLYPNAVICWCNPIQGAEKFPKVVDQWASRLRTLTSWGGVNNIETNRCGIMMANETHANGEDLIDGLHPNENGAMKMAKYNAAAISKLFI